MPGRKREQIRSSAPAGMLDPRSQLASGERARKERAARRNDGGDIGLLFLVLALVGVGVALISFIVASQNSGSLFDEIEAAQPAQTTVTIVEPEAAADPEVPQPTTINLVMVGDVLPHSDTLESGRTGSSYNFDHLFAQVAPEVQAADVALVNQETVLGGTQLEGGITEFPRFNSPQEIGDAEVNAGFDVVLKATNHTFDKGYPALHNELEFWATRHPEIAVVGATDPDGVYQGYVNDVYVYVKDDFRIAVLNYTWATNEGVGPLDASVLSYMDESKIRADVAKARELGADLIVACPHWGIEYEVAPSWEEHDYASLFLELGVDVVIGCHPHVIQPVQVLTRDDGHQMLVFYSLGNFTSGMFSYDRCVGGMAHVRMVKEPSGAAYVSAYQFIPLVCVVANGTNYTTYELPQFTEEIAAAYGNRGGLSKAMVEQLCSRVLGEGFDRTTGLLSASMDAPPAAPAELMDNPAVPKPVTTEGTGEGAAEEQAAEAEVVEVAAEAEEPAWTEGEAGY